MTEKSTQQCAAWCKSTNHACTRRAVGANTYGHMMCAQHGGKESK